MLLGGVFRSHVAKTRNIVACPRGLGDLDRAGARCLPARSGAIIAMSRPAPAARARREPAPDHRRPTMGAHGVIRHRLRLERQPGVNLGDGGGDALAVESACVKESSSSRALRLPRARLRGRRHARGRRRSHQGALPPRPGARAAWHRPPRPHHEGLHRLLNMWNARRGQGWLHLPAPPAQLHGGARAPTRLAVDVLIQCFYALSLVAHFLLPKHLHAFSKQLRIARASSARGHSLFARRTRRAHATAAACTPSSSRGSTSPPRVAPRPPAPPSTRPRGAPYATHRCPPSPPSASRDIAPMAPVPVCGAPRARPAPRARAKLL
jgi:hypothetical protein